MATIFALSVCGLRNEVSRIWGFPTRLRFAGLNGLFSGSMDRRVAALHFDVAISAACQRILLLSRHLLDQAACMASELPASAVLTLAAMRSTKERVFSTTT